MLKILMLLLGWVFPCKDLPVQDQKIYVYVDDETIERLYIRMSDDGVYIRDLLYQVDNLAPVKCTLQKYTREYPVTSFFEHPYFGQIVLRGGMSFTRVMPDYSEKDFYPATFYKHQNAYLMTTGAPYFLLQLAPNKPLIKLKSQRPKVVNGLKVFETSVLGDDTLKYRITYFTNDVPAKRFFKVEHQGKSSPFYFSP